MWGLPEADPAEAECFGREVQASPFSRFSYAKCPLGSRKELMYTGVLQGLCIYIGL